MSIRSFDLDEATPDGKYLLDLEDIQEETIAYFEVNIRCGGLYD